MSYVAGVDFSSFAIDIVLLGEEGGDATWIRRRLDTGPGDAVARARRVRDLLPSRGAWRDSGVVTVAIEQPRGEQKGAAPLLMVLGGLLQTLPAALPVILMPPWEWRQECGLPGSGPRGTMKEKSVGFARSMWANPPARFDDNAAEAFAIAWALRSKLERGIAARSVA